MGKKIIRTVLYAFGGILSLVVLFVLVTVAPLDRTPYRERDAYQEMQDHLSTLSDISIPTPVHGFHVGYAVESITPSWNTSLAGSGPRKKEFTAIHDSIFVRTMVIGNGAERVALVAADLLIIPPRVTQLLEEQLPSIGYSLNNTYLAATHTHNSVGNWGEYLAGRIYSGPYSDSLVHFITDHIIRSIAKANDNMLPAKISSGQFPVGGILTNRLADEAGGIDSLMRVIEVVRSDSSKLVLTSFTGHPTCARSDSYELSRDYPGVLVDRLEQQGYTFAMFMAGAVGSHACLGPERGWPRVEYIGEVLASRLLDHRDSLTPVYDSALFMVRVPLALPKPQVRLTKDWRLRAWAFDTFFGKYPASLTALRLGDLVMIGSPCDFSGELMPPIDSVATSGGYHAMVTSFNGAYIGYITLDKHFDIDHYETRIMSWYGPGNGAYLTECIIDLMKATEH